MKVYYSYLLLLLYSRLSCDFYFIILIKFTIIFLFN